MQDIPDKDIGIMYDLSPSYVGKKRKRWKQAGVYPFLIREFFNLLLEGITPQNIAIKIVAQVRMDIEMTPGNKMNYLYILTLLNFLLLINLNITQIRCYKTKQNPYFIVSKKSTHISMLFDKKGRSL